MTVVSIVSSPRKGGFGDRIAAEIEEGARSAGKDVVRFDLNDLRSIRQYQNCEACKHNGGVCVLKDDIAPVIDAIRDAEGIILDTSIQFNEMNGLFKTVFDRLYCFLDMNATTIMEKGKKGVQEPGERHGPALLLRTRRQDRVLHMDDAEGHACGSVRPGRGPRHRCQVPIMTGRGQPGPPRGPPPGCRRRRRRQGSRRRPIDSRFSNISSLPPLDPTRSSAVAGSTSMRMVASGCGRNATRSLWTALPDHPSR